MRPPAPYYGECCKDEEFIFVIYNFIKCIFFDEYYDSGCVRGCTGPFYIDVWGITVHLFGWVICLCGINSRSCSAQNNAFKHRKIIILRRKNPLRLSHCGRWFHQNLINLNKKEEWSFGVSARMRHSRSRIILFFLCTLCAIIHKGRSIGLRVITIIYGTELR